ncbi:unnamed protein product [Gongylonema pulchrum]|uniref:Secreted protein n=1 Tax=Gongylonema pulchrum TaxID=637853 RepID=A0A183EAG1_9BILA|nr:unnamed protein product [Gongylonema pulchrum]
MCGKADTVVFIELDAVDSADDDDDDTASHARGLCQRRCDARFAGQLNTCKMLRCISKLIIASHAYANHI